MAEPHVINALRAKQDEIRRRIADLEKQVTACRSDLATISEALRIFGEPKRESVAAPLAMIAELPCIGL